MTAANRVVATVNTPDMISKLSRLSDESELSRLSGESELSRLSGKSELSRLSAKVSYLGYPDYPSKV